MLDAEDAACMVVRLYGSLPNDTTAQFPLKAGARWIIVNDTTGNKTLTVKGASGTGVVVAQGKRLHVHCNGTNFYASNTDPQAMGAMPSGRLAKSVAGGSNVTLTLIEAAYGILEFTGEIAGTIDIIFPALDGRQWSIRNMVTYADDYDLSIKASGGSESIFVPEHGRGIVYCDGAELISITDMFVP